MLTRIEIHNPKQGRYHSEFYHHVLHDFIKPRVYDTRRTVLRKREVQLGRITNNKSFYGEFYGAIRPQNDLTLPLYKYNSP